VQIAPGMDSARHLYHLVVSRGYGSVNSMTASFTIESCLEQCLQVMVMPVFDQHWIFLSVLWKTLPSEETELPINQGGDNQPGLEKQRPNHAACASQLIFPVQLLCIQNSAVDDVKRGFRWYCRTRSAGRFKGSVNSFTH
jgi:hypothetical protein